MCCTCITCLSKYTVLDPVLLAFSSNILFLIAEAFSIHEAGLDPWRVSVCSGVGGNFIPGVNILRLWPGAAVHLSMSPGCF